MNLAAISIRRPIFISCLILLILIVGYISLRTLPVDLFPDVTIPVVTVRTTYAGSGPVEIETQITKPLEDALSSVAGIDIMKSTNREGVSQITLEFDLDVDIKYAEQQVRAQIASVRNRLPDDIDEPEIRTVDPADQPILVMALTADLSVAELFDLANEVVKPRISQVNQVGLVEIMGGRKREIQVQLDRDVLISREISAQQVAAQIGAAGRNVPLGKIDREGKESVFRAVGEYRDLNTIASTIVRFTGNEHPVTIGDLGRVVDTLEDETSRTFVDGKKSLLLAVFRQSKANTIGVADRVKAQIERINSDLGGTKGMPRIEVVRDGSKPIRDNVYDVNETILIGIVLTVIVVYFFLGSGRSTLITGLALPNSLLGAFILMLIAGFSINIMSLLALSLAVGLLIDDAIVVRENIYRHVEMGKKPYEAALVGTNEVTLAVIATTFTILAVFGPIGFLQGVVGQYLKEFGLTICFAMLVSLFDALTIAPMLSSYLAAKHEEEAATRRRLIGRASQAMLKAFDRFQSWLERIYERALHWILRFPIAVLVGSLLIFILSVYLMKFIPKTFLPPQDNGEFLVNIDLPSGTALEATARLAEKIDSQLRQEPGVDMTVLTVGNQNGEANKAEIYVKLVPAKMRAMNTTQAKDRVRELLKPYAHANPQVSDASGAGGGRQFQLNVTGSDLRVLEEFTARVLAWLKKHPALTDPDTSFREGKPELQVAINNARAEMLGLQTAALGEELRVQIQGDTPAVFRDQDREYDVRVRMKDDQRDLNSSFRSIYVPNINQNLVPLAAAARPVDAQGPATILRENRSRYIQLTADIAANGPGMGTAIQDVTRMLTSGELRAPPGVGFGFSGQAKRFGELMMNMVIAMGLGILFIYLVLCSLYESFVTPLTIMLVFPLAICGALFALFLTQSTLDLFSMIGCVTLLGLATKNSILLVDYANHRVQEGADLKTAIIESGRTRLRPILMTTFALVAGMVPVAIGLNEASKQRTSLGIAVIGGTISSTLLTLLVVPAAYSYMERFRVWVNTLFFRYIGSEVPKAFLEDPRVLTSVAEDQRSDSVQESGALVFAGHAADLSFAEPPVAMARDEVIDRVP